MVHLKDALTMVSSAFYIFSKIYYTHKCFLDCLALAHGCYRRFYIQLYLKLHCHPQIEKSPCHDFTSHGWEESVNDPAWSQLALENPSNVTEKPWESFLHFCLGRTSSLDVMFQLEKCFIWICDSSKVYPSWTSTWERESCEY